MKKERNEKELMNLFNQMNSVQKKYFEELVKDVERLADEAKNKKITKENFTKALFIVDMNNGFVNFGAMSNPKYNELVPEQFKLINKFRYEQQLVNFIMEGHYEEAVEFLLYPPHCILGTEEAEVIPEFKDEQNKENTRTYYKNNTNGALNLNLHMDLETLKDLKEIVVCGVCTDICVLDFVLTLAKFLDQINRKVKIFVVLSAIDTFDAPNHNRDEWTEIAIKMMEHVGAEVVKDYEELNNREKVLGLVPKN